MDLQAKLERVFEKVEPDIGKGRVADYIPALAGVDRRKFALAVVTVDGETAEIGNAGEAFSLQSISKVFALAIVLQSLGDELWARVGREPSGSPFNSIVQLEHEHGIPRNPLINAGAIVVDDILLGQADASATIARILDFVHRAADDDNIDVDAEVAASEAEAGYRNFSLAHFMKGFGNLDNRVGDILSVYFKQCAIAMNCRQLARAGLFLAADGTDPITGRRIVGPEIATRLNALMLTCGHYDASGDFAFRVGLPGKSGVGGGILGLAPGHGAIAAWSPCLNDAGNSHAGTLALAHLAKETGWSIF